MLRSSLMSTEEEDCLYFDIRIDLNMMRPWARTYHQGSVTTPFRDDNFSPMISLLAITTSLKRRANILDPLVLTEGAGLVKAMNP